MDAPPKRIKLALLTTDAREHHREYDKPEPYFGAAPAALVEGFVSLQNEIEVHLVACTQRPLKSPERLAANIWFHSLVVPKFGWMRTAYQGCIRATRKKLRELRPDVVHGQGTERDCAMCAVFSGFPNVITIHGNMVELARLFKNPIGSFGWLAARLENFALKRTRGVFCNSAYTESLVKPRTLRTWRVPNPLRSQFFSPSKPASSGGKPVLVNVGVINPRKRQLELLNVAESLHRRGLAVDFHFIGQATPGESYSDAFLERVRQAEREGYAHYLGCKSVAQLVECFNLASALIHFPTEEAFGLVVAEALARNLKFFGARVGGINDIADRVLGAELYELNEWDGLTAGITQWVRNGCVKPSGADTVMRSRYSPEVVAQRHVEIYREVLKTVE